MRRTLRWLASGAIALLLARADAAQVVVNGPPGSGEFGRAVVTLPNGNFVATDPLFDLAGVPPIVDAGAVYLYRPDGTLISTLHGSSANDRVGRDSVVVLANGNYVICSADWDNGAVVDAGAVTFASGATGVSGPVSPANSLVGSAAFHNVGGSGAIALANGNYVVANPFWDNGAIIQAGAVTFGSGTSGISGPVSPSNSLVGSRMDDQVGFAVTALPNGNYVVATTTWDNGAVVDAGAVTFGSGTVGISGPVTSANSLVGTTTIDRVGFSVIALSNGNYVVRSPVWNRGAIVAAGAVTFGSGTAGISGPVSPANSLVGSTADDRVGNFGVTALSNGNYVVASAFWDHGAIVDVGAATFGSGIAGISGPISPANSLVGSAAGDSVGDDSVTALSNGNYVVVSAFWDNGAIVDAGAATFGSGIVGISGPVSPANSLVGGTAGDQVGLIGGVTALSNGNYVVNSPNWDNGAIVNAGAATFGSGTTGISGTVTSANSLVGGTAGDGVGSRGAIALANGNYVVRSHGWDNGAIVNAGAATFGPGVAGFSGPVSPANSLVGGTPNDFVSLGGVTALSNGDYVVATTNWDDGPVVDAGAVTFGSGSVGISGAISPGNSVVGSTESDRVGYDGVTALPNGHYVVGSSFWDNGAIANAGAVTLGLSTAEVVGPITDTHSVLGLVGGGGPSSFGYDPLRNQLAVGQRASNRVVLQRTGVATSIGIVGDTPDPSIIGQAVTFTATITAAPTTPANGQVRFAASSGETCVDDTPTPTSPTTVDYSCAIAFTSNGVSTVVAEYTGSIDHAYSGSAPELHATTDSVFADGFETL